jgi:argininosuccinate synthase
MSLYDTALATYDASSTFDQTWSNGFIEIWAMPTVVANALKRREQAKKLQDNILSKATSVPPKSR